MSDMVCLECGKEMEYDWAPCPHCGWKAPEPWEGPEETETPSRPSLQKPNAWIRWTAVFLLLVGFLFLLFRFFDH